MRTISQISVWKSSNKSDVRVYISFKEDKNQGVYYKTGNAYNAKGTLENLTVEEKSEALKISSSFHGQGIWGQVYENQIINNTPSKTQSISNENFDLKGLNSDLNKGFNCNIADYLNM